MANILRLRALEQRRLPPKLTQSQQRILARANELARLGFDRKTAIDVALDEEV